MIYEYNSWWNYANSGRCYPCEYSTVHTVFYMYSYLVVNTFANSMQSLYFLMQSPPKCIRSSSNINGLPPEYLSEAQEIKFPVSVTVGPAAEQPTHAFGYYYAPKACALIWRFVI